MLKSSNADVMSLALIQPEPRVRTPFAAFVIRFTALPRWLLAAARRKAATHGVDPRIFVALYVLSAIPFYAGIYFILRGSGVLDVSLRSLLAFDLHQVHPSGGTVALGLLINRLGWALPYLYVEIRGHNIRWYVHAAVWLWIGLSVWSIL